jgi:hypothetical protein
VTVDETLETVSIERQIELVGKLQVFSTVGDEYAKLPSVGRGGPVRLRHSDTSGFRRSWTGCVMCKVYRSEPCHDALGDLGDDG